MLSQSSLEKIRPQEKTNIQLQTPVAPKSSGNGHSHFVVGPKSSGSGHSHFACGPKVEWEWSLPLRCGPKNEWEWPLPRRLWPQPSVPVVGPSRRPQSPVPVIGPSCKGQRSPDGKEPSRRQKHNFSRNRWCIREWSFYLVKVQKAYTPALVPIPGVYANCSFYLHKTYTPALGETPGNQVFSLGDTAHDGCPLEAR